MPPGVHVFLVQIKNVVDNLTLTERRSPEYSRYTHKWMISIDSPSYVSRPYDLEYPTHVCGTDTPYHDHFELCKSCTLRI